MSRGGKRPGAGRPKGKQNKVHQKAKERAAETGLLPHEFLLKVARGEEIDGHIPTFAERVDAAKAAAPFYQPKLAQVQQEVKAEFKAVLSADPMSRDEWVDTYAKTSSLEAPEGTAEGAS